MLGESRFDLALSYPQWQGSGRSERLSRGAAATAAVCARFAPLETVPLSNDESEIDGIRHGGAIMAQMRAAKAILEARQPLRVMTAGGDCAIDIAVIDYLNAQHRGMTVLWIDAHLDANTPQTSPSGAFHGMCVTALLGYAPPMIRPLLRSPIEASRFRYFGSRVADEGELMFQRDHDLKLLDPEEALHGPVHIHFDLDVLDPDEFRHLAYRDGELAVDAAVALVSRVARDADIVGFTLAEFAPANDADARDGSIVMARLCEAAAGGTKTL